MPTVNMHEAKTRLSKLVRSVEEKNEVVVLCRNGKPVAEIKNPSKRCQRSRLTPDPVLRRVVVNYDPTEPLTEEEWPSECR